MLDLFGSDHSLEFVSEVIMSQFVFEPVFDVNYSELHHVTVADSPFVEFGVDVLLRKVFGFFELYFLALEIFL